ncbi:MAG TPA: NAD-dependent epimerase [Burkholderiales bacterium]|nr:NAD-dependent epimerase [Burkholderiales bacterium]
MKILVTGCAGFIGMNTAARLLKAGHEVVGIDCVNDYYDVNLKERRLKNLGTLPGFEFHRFDLAELGVLQAVFAKHRFERVLHLAAQAGVRYSLVNPHAYVKANLEAFINMLECCRAQQTPHFVYASSSSVYGANAKQPFSTHDAIDHPVSLYAATKRANELMAHSYSHLFSLPTTGLRFFTVYGPWGRPDMSMALFTDAILAGRPINVFNNGQMRRDFTYIDDIVEGVVRVLDHLPQAAPVGPHSYDDPAKSAAPFRVFNIGNNTPVPLMDMIGLIEAAVGKKALFNFMPMQPGDVAETSADTDDLENAVGFRPATPLPEGIKRYVAWHREYHQV